MKVFAGISGIPCAVIGRFNKNAVFFYFFFRKAGLECDVLSSGESADKKHWDQSDQSAPVSKARTPDIHTWINTVSQNELLYYVREKYHLD